MAPLNSVIKTKRHWFAIAAIVVLIVTGMLWAISAREPIHEGKTLSAWFDEFCSYPKPGMSYSFNATGGRVLFLVNGGIAKPIDDPALNAIRSMGSNAAPFLIKKLRAKESSYLRLYSALFSKSPPWVGRFFPQPKNYAKITADAATALSVLGDSAAEAIPELLKVLKSRRWPSTPIQIVQALRALVKDPRVLHPTVVDLCQESQFDLAIDLIDAFGLSSPKITGALAAGLGGPNPKAKIEVLRRLGRMGEDTEAVIPAIAACLNDSNKEIRYAAASALANIGPSARDSRAVLQKAAEDQETIVRNAAKRALTAIQSDAKVE